jgi:hypothetical protein
MRMESPSPGNYGTSPILNLNQFISFVAKAMSAWAGIWRGVRAEQFSHR